MIMSLNTKPLHRKRPPRPLILQPHKIPSYPPTSMPSDRIPRINQPLNAGHIHKVN